MNDTEQLIAAGRKLLSGALGGVLSTHSLEHEGYPFGSLVPYSLNREGWPLLLLSHLAQHTRNLAQDPRCSLTVSGNINGDIQQSMRLTCLGDICPLESPDPGLVERHLDYFPDSRVYFEELNFRFFQMHPIRFYVVGGFGAARWLGKSRLHCPIPWSHGEEREQTEKLEPTLRTRSGFLENSPPKVVGIDPFGVDARFGERLARINFDRKISHLEQAQAAL